MWCSSNSNNNNKKKRYCWNCSCHGHEPVILAILHSPLQGERAILGLSNEAENKAYKHEFPGLYRELASCH